MNAHHGSSSGKLTYGTYLRVPELLALQQPRSTPPHHDELLFIISHQVYELWFKQMRHELDGACAYLDADEPLKAAQLFERIHKIQHLLIEQIPMLETMFAVDFAEFRSALNTASGFQSVQFRRIEFLCGNKNEKMLALVGEEGPEQAREKRDMEIDLRRPTPYDHFLRHLAREDDDVFKVPPDALARDTSQPHDEHTGCVDSLLTLYREHDRYPRGKAGKGGGGGGGERYYAQFRVAEHLIEFDEKFAIWRFHHVKMVERMIGSRPGTGGSPGAKYLASTLARPFFPDLWAVRTKLGGGY